MRYAKQIWWRNYVLQKSLNCKRKPEFEISNIETIWSEITLPNSKPFLICTVYRPPNVSSEWIDLLEEELSIAQTTGLELIMMGDINIDYASCTNNKWQNLVELFDLTQLVTEPTRITQSTSTIIDHIYTSNPENVSECFVPYYSLSDHFPVCFTRKVSCKISKAEHTSTTYRCYKHFNEALFLSDLSADLESFTIHNSDIDKDFTAWISIIQNQLDRHAPVKTRRVKSKYLPEWFTQEILNARRMRDNSKRLKQWSDYKKFRNLTRDLIRSAKKKHFSESVTNLKDTRSIWNQFRSVTNKPSASKNRLPEELKITNFIQILKT